METIALDSLCSDWRGRLIPEAFERVKIGIDRETRRLIGARFIVFGLLREHDIDGLFERIFALEPCGTLEMAERTALELSAKEGNRISAKLPT